MSDNGDMQLDSGGDNYDLDDMDSNSKCNTIMSEDHDEKTTL